MNKKNISLFHWFQTAIISLFHWCTLTKLNWSTNIHSNKSIRQTTANRPISDPTNIPVVILLLDISYSNRLVTLNTNAYFCSQESLRTKHRQHVCEYSDLNDNKLILFQNFHFFSLNTFESFIVSFIWEQNHSIPTLCRRDSFAQN